MKDKLLTIIFIFISTASFSIEIDLQTAQCMALESSTNIRHISEQLELSARKHRLDLRDLLPSADFSFGTSSQTNYHSADSDLIQLGLDLSQTVFNGGRNASKRKLEEIQLILAASSLESEKALLTDTVWQSFYGIHLYNEKLKLQEELLNISKNQLEITKKKYEIGTLTELDFLEATIEIGNMRLDINDTKSSLKELSRDFSVLLGLDYLYLENNNFILKGSINRDYQGLNLQESNHTFWENIAESKNLDIQKKKAELNQLTAEYKISRRSFIPSISLDASIYIRGDDFPLQETGGTISISFNFPYQTLPTEAEFGAGLQSPDKISDSSDITTSLLPNLDFLVTSETSKLELVQASEVFAETLESLTRQIRISLEKIENLKQKLEIRRNTQTIQRKRLEIMEKRSSLGEVSELDLLETRIEFYQEEIIIRECVMELMQSERDFERLTGIEPGTLDLILKRINSGGQQCSQK